MEKKKFKKEMIGLVIALALIIGIISFGLYLNFCEKTATPIGIATLERDLYKPTEGSWNRCDPFYGLHSYCFSFLAKLENGKVITVWCNEDWNCEVGDKVIIEKLESCYPTRYYVKSFVIE